MIASRSSTVAGVLAITVTSQTGKERKKSEENSPVCFLQGMFLITPRYTSALTRIWSTWAYLTVKKAGRVGF
jgi:hypothetical protein